MRQFGIVAILCLGVALSLAMAACGDDDSSADASADASVADDCDGFPEQDIELVIPYSAGGGFDASARALAPFIEENLPNDVNVLPVNRDAGGGLVGVTEVYGSPPDGYRIAITEPGLLATAQLLDQTEVDLAEIAPIAQVASSPEVVLVSADSEWDSIEDVQAAAEQEAVLMATAGLAAVNIIPFNELGIPFEEVLHEGSTEAILSIVRGDTDISVFPVASAAESLRNGELKPLLLIGDPPAQGEVAAKEVADVPTLDEAIGAEGLGASLQQHRFLMAAPGTPECVIDILNQAVTASLEDPELVDQFRNADLTPDPTTPEETRAMVDENQATIEENADTVQNQLGG